MDQPLRSRCLALALVCTLTAVGGSSIIQDEEPQIHGDRDRLLEVFLNLLSNAIKFNTQNGSVQISARPGKSGYAVVTIRDSGVGIPPESLGRIFDRHYRVDRPAGESPEGSGLGLTIVRDILRLHGCTIHVDSEEGRGAAFTFAEARWGSCLRRRGP